MATPESQFAMSKTGRGAISIGRVVERPAHARDIPGTLADVIAWLRGPARRIGDSLDFLDELCWRLVGTGLPLARMTFHLPTLHPQYYSRGCRWSRATGTTEEVLVAHGVIESEMYRTSALRPALEKGEVVRRRLDGPNPVLDFPILSELRAAGITDYLVVPLEMSNGRHIAITLATDRAGGLQDGELDELRQMGPHLASLLEIQIGRQVMGSVLDAYLGRQIGRRVRDGDIVRGRGEVIRAIVWMCDLRGFTRLSDRLPGEQVISILNAYFERVVAAIHQREGEVLKFMGDGLLAIFAVPDAGLAPDATGRALAAAEAAIAAVDGLAGDPILGGEPPPKMCVSIHYGDVIYGNIGALDRLDFTTIGPAVNLVARLDQLTKTLDRRILVTDDFKRVCSHPLQSLGTHPLRGLSEPHEIYTIPDSGPARS